MRIEFPALNDMVVQGLDEIQIPKMIKIRQLYDAQHLEDVKTHLLQELNETVKDPHKLEGKSVCIGVGSRGIPHLPEIVRTICDWLKEKKAAPFIIPAMGSHGGATAEGQREILKGYGITEMTMGVPIIAQMDVVQYGELDNGTPLYCDKNAYNADWIVLINKEKPHTAFRGTYESGLVKMIAIGIAKHKGAAAFHRQGIEQFPVRLPEAAACFLDKLPLLFGVGIVENAYDEICALKVTGPEHFLETDAWNLKLAKEKMAGFKFRKADVLIVDEIGKNISGHGHDPNITGRAAVQDDSFKSILDLQRMVILGVSQESHHNGNGIADADITTRKCLNDIDWSVLWTNVLTSNVLTGCKIPMYANNDKEAIMIALRTCLHVDMDHIKIARIHNTLDMECIEVSQALYDQIKDRPDIAFVEGPYELKFNEKGDLL